MTITTQTHLKMTGINHQASGALLGSNVDVDFPTDGVTAHDLVLTLGFVPKHFKITALDTAPVSAEWHEGMASGYYLLTVGAGDKTYVNTDVLLVNSDGTVNIDTNDPTFLINAKISIWEARG